ncbi:MAG: acyl-CoA dehydrogenase family protein, partial [Acidobacteriaceae bacterium]|nr:acyl-CoA dehydrogenase family protein [Acidobacteriaceae bacterium]
MSTTTAPIAADRKVLAGGSFLISNPAPADCFFPEDFTREQRQIAQTTAEFALNEVVPRSDQIEAKDFAVTRRLIQKASELGLTSVDIPEEYGGLDMDKVTSALIADNIAKQGSFSVSFSAHVGIGTLPIVWYGTEEQKKKYLPKLASGEWVGAYALSESTSGSDALNARAHAVLAEDGLSYTLNGEKMWITNAGFADLFTIFAKCAVKEGKDAGKELLTAFLVEKGTPGLTIGKEEHKLGIRGSSTCPLILNNCRIPASNLLGEVGKGHHIAFNILNVGRYKLGNAAVGAARTCLGKAIRYATERKAFGKPIAEFGLIQEKLADCAVGVFVGEALSYRVVGMIDAALAKVDKIAKRDTEAVQRAIEDYAVECSIVKVWDSEMLDRVVDEVLQIYAGYGYVEEYPAERAYRDSRINRIFEGTNEINRLIITGRLMKSAMNGKLALMPAIRQIMDEVMS